MFRSFNKVRKETAALARGLRRLPPDPRLSPTVQLDGGHFGGLLNVLGIRERSTSRRIASIEPPPAFLHIEPTRPLPQFFWDEVLIIAGGPAMGCAPADPFAQQKASVLLKQTAKFYLNYWFLEIFH